MNQPDISPAARRISADDQTVLVALRRTMRNRGLELELAQGRYSVAVSEVAVKGAELQATYALLPGEGVNADGTISVVQPLPAVEADAIHSS